MGMIASRSWGALRGSMRRRFEGSRWVAHYRQSHFPSETRDAACAQRVAQSTSGDWIHNHHRRQFETDGYMVIRNVIPTNLVANAVREISAFVRADISDCSTWHRGPLIPDGIVPMHHAQALWDLRQSPNLYEVFTEFFGTHRLMVDMNRCLFRPPVDRRFPKVSHGTIHWDTDPRGPAPASLQGVVLLSDVERDGGGFQCLPGVYRNLDAWLKRYARASDFDFFNPGLNHWKTTQVEGNAGDVILWTTKLPHGSARNLSARPRVAAFVSMEPCGDNMRLRESTKQWWLTKRAPDYWRGLPGQLDPEPGKPAELSELGLKLIGATPWDDSDHIGKRFSQLVKPGVADYCDGNTQQP
jgi:hypothetical protein